MIVGGRGDDVIEFHALEFPAVLVPRFSPGRFDQNSPHRFGRRGKEVTAIVELLIANET